MKIVFMKNKFFNFSLLIIFLLFSFFSGSLKVEAKSSVTCSVDASVNGSEVVISGNVTENSPELDASYTTVYISDSAGAGSNAGTGQEGSFISYTVNLPPGFYTAYVQGTGETNPSGSTSVCSSSTNFTVSNPGVNGQCAPSHYNCNLGTSGSQNSGTNWTWTCYGSGGGSDASCSEAKATPTVTISASPSSIVSGNRVDLNWSSTNVTDCYASNGWTGGQPTSGTTPVYPTQTTTYRIDCSSVASGSTWAQTTVTVSASAMSGTLTPASQGCTLASGATTCNATLSWTTNNPVGTSAVTNNGGATPASSPGNTGNNVVFAVPYNPTPGLNGVTSFFLYNNQQQLAAATVTVCNTATPWNGATCGTNNPPVGSHDTATCTDSAGWSIDWDAPNSPVRIQIFDGPYAANKVAVGDFSASLTRSDLNPGVGISKDHGFVWTIPTSLKDNVAHTLYAYALDLQDGSRTALNFTPRAITCAPPAMSGTLTAPSCIIPLNGSNCNTTVTWSVTNPEANLTQVTSAIPAPGTVVGSGVSGTAAVSLSQGGQTFYLYNNAKSLVPTSPNGSGVFANATCVSGTNWNGTKCSSSYPALSVDLKLNSGAGFATSGDYATSDKSLPVLLGEALRLSWNANGSPLLNCMPKDGSAGDGWNTGLAVSNVGTQNVTAPSILGTLKYTLDCTQGSSTATDQSWIDVVIVKVEGTHVIWKCGPTATDSLGKFTSAIGSGTFRTDIDNNRIGDLSGDIIMHPTVSTNYQVLCNDGSEGSAPMPVPKKPVFKEN